MTEHLDRAPSSLSRLPDRLRALLPARLAGPLSVEQELQSIIGEELVGPLLRGRRPRPEFKAALLETLLDDFDRQKRNT